MITDAHWHLLAKDKYLLLSSIKSDDDCNY